MIIGRGYIKEPDNAVVVVTLEMPLKELRLMKEQIIEATDNNSKWPLYQALNIFAEVIRKAEKDFYVNENDIGAKS